jgi:hypothetical protein
MSRKKPYLSRKGRRLMYRREVVMFLLSSTNNDPGKKHVFEFE